MIHSSAGRVGSSEASTKARRVALPIGSAEAADVIASRARPEVMDTRAPRAAAAPKAAPMSIHVLRRRARRTPAAIRPAEIHGADSPNLKMKADRKSVGEGAR